jgi:hypothetical protein
MRLSLPPLSPNEKEGGTVRARFERMGMIGLVVSCASVWGGYFLRLSVLSVH